MTPQDIIQLIDRGGVVTLLAAALVFTVVGLHRGWWYGSPYVRELLAQREALVKRIDDERAEKDRWQQLALTLLEGQQQSTRTMATIAERVAGTKDR